MIQMEHDRPIVEQNSDISVILRCRELMLDSLREITTNMSEIDRLMKELKVSNDKKAINKRLLRIKSINTYNLMGVKGMLYIIKTKTNVNQEILDIQLEAVYSIFENIVSYITDNKRNGMYTE